MNGIDFGLMSEEELQQVIDDAPHLRTWDSVNMAVHWGKKAHDELWSRKNHVSSENLEGMSMSQLCDHQVRIKSGLKEAEDWARIAHFSGGVTSCIRELNAINNEFNRRKRKRKREEQTSVEPMVLVLLE